MAVAVDIMYVARRSERHHSFVAAASVDIEVSDRVDVMSRYATGRIAGT
jgi:hypothetical protein